MPPRCRRRRPGRRRRHGPAERRAAFWLQLSAINFGSRWFPTLRMCPGLSGYLTIEAGLREHGPWEASALSRIAATAIDGDDALWRRGQRRR